MSTTEAPRKLDRTRTYNAKAETIARHHARQIKRGNTTTRAGNRRAAQD